MSDNHKDRENFVRYMSLVYRHQHTVIISSLNDESINDITSTVLVCVYRNPGNTQNEIAKRCALDKSIVSKKITELEKSGYVTRKKNEDNRKFYHIYLTDLGVALVNKSLFIQEGIWDKVFDDESITPDEIKTAAKLMEKIADIMVEKSE